MPRRRHRARRVPRHAVYRFYLAGIAVLILGAGCIFFGCPHERPQHSLWSSILALNTHSVRQAEEKESPHLIYPYSIVAGGVHSPQELQGVINTDPVAAAHYAGFILAKGHLIRLQHDRYAYVSFRVGDNVYWTSHKLRLRTGEILLTDGERYIRTRCGNRLSKDARFPIYRHEPSARILNTPLPDSPVTGAYPIAELTALSFLPGVSEQPSLLLAPPGGAFERTAYTPPSYTPFLPLLTEPGCTEKNFSSKRCGNSETLLPPPPLAATPENGVGILFSSGIGILWACWILRRKRTAVES